MDDGPALLIRTSLPHAQYTSASLFSWAKGRAQGRASCLLLNDVAVLDNHNLVMVIMMKDVLSILVLAASPQTENAASTFAGWVGIGVGSGLLDGWCVEAVPDA